MGPCQKALGWTNPLQDGLHACILRVRHAGAHALLQVHGKLLPQSHHASKTVHLHMQLCMSKYVHRRTSTSARAHPHCLHYCCTGCAPCVTGSAGASHTHTHTHTHTQPVHLMHRLHAMRCLLDRKMLLTHTHTHSLRISCTGCAPCGACYIGRCFTHTYTHTACTLFAQGARHAVLAGSADAGTVPLSELGRAGGPQHRQHQRAYFKWVSQQAFVCAHTEWVNQWTFQVETFKLKLSTQASRAQSSGPLHRQLQRAPTLSGRVSGALSAHIQRLFSQTCKQALPGCTPSQHTCVHARILGESVELNGLLCLPLILHVHPACCVNLALSHGRCIPGVTPTALLSSPSTSPMSPL
eukprot:1158038-Pelagomonas_calceolata.AAC.5